MSTLLLLISIALYSPVCIYTWRKLLRTMAENEARYTSQIQGGIHSVTDFSCAIVIATVLCVIVPPIYLGARLFGVMGTLLDGIGVERSVRLLAGESDHIRDERIERERIMRSVHIDKLEQQHKLGPYNDNSDLEVLDVGNESGSIN